MDDVPVSLDHQSRPLPGGYFMLGHALVLDPAPKDVRANVANDQALAQIVMRDHEHDLVRQQL